MSTHAPRSYDEIIRHTVPEPDGSYRADPPMTDAELRLDKRMRHAISEALIAARIDTLGFEVERGRVILRGWVRDSAALSRIEELVTDAAPEAVLDIRMHMGFS
jgi:hypothetical protein